MKFLGPLQMRIMQVMWYADDDYMKARQMWKKLNQNENEPELAYTTVNTVMTSLCKCNFLQRVMIKNSYTYTARLREDQYELQILRYCADAFHNGDIDDLRNEVNFIHLKNT